jgi:hypothetical protein
MNILGQTNETYTSPLVALANCLAILGVISIPDHPTLEGVLKSIVEKARIGMKMNPDHIKVRLQELVDGWVVTATNRDFEIPDNAVKMEIFKHFQVPVYTENRTRNITLTKQIVFWRE